MQSLLKVASTKKKNSIMLNQQMFFLLKFPTTNSLLY